MTTTVSIDSLSDNALLCRFGELVQRDREGSAYLLRHIDAIDRRKLWARDGYSSMFAFLVAHHHMSESTAAKRIGAARTAHRFPVVFAMVARGELHLSGHRLKALLTPQNHAEVLAAAKHKTMRQIDALVAQLAPQPDVPTTLRALPRRTHTPPAAAPLAAPQPTAVQPTAAPPTAAPLAAPQPTAAQPTTTTAPSAAPTSALLPAPGASESAPAVQVTPKPAPGRIRRDPDPIPLSPGRYRLQLTIGESAYAKLKELQDLLGHRIPNGDPAAIVERALDMLLTQVRKRKTGASDKPRSTSALTSAKARRARTGPAAIRREVWRRDQGRCAFLGADGHRCNETRRLEFAHVEPWAKQGETTVENLSLRCAAHNAFEADRDYGTSFMAYKRKRKGREKPLKAREETLGVRERVARYVVRGVPCPRVAAPVRPHNPGLRERDSLGS